MHAEAHNKPKKAFATTFKRLRLNLMAVAALKCGEARALMVKVELTIRVSNQHCPLGGFQ